MKCPSCKKTMIANAYPHYSTHIWHSCQSCKKTITSKRDFYYELFREGGLSQGEEEFISNINPFKKEVRELNTFLDIFYYDI